MGKNKWPGIAALSGCIFALALFSLWGIEGPEAAPPAPPDANRGAEKRAILSRGNEPVKGLPGFAENVFPALYGRYRLELSGAGEDPEEPEFSLWLSREPLYLFSPWRPEGEEDADYGLFVRVDEGVMLAALIPDRAELYTAIFRFPASTREALGEAGLIRLMEAWLSRFLYFCSLAEDEAGVSLPAAVSF
jgi:hypothetical protein